MAKFAITRARQTLGFVPTTNVRANINTDTAAGAVGAAVGQGALKLGKQAIQRKQRQDALEEQLRIKNRANLDSLSNRKADEQRKLTAEKIRVMKFGSPPEEWEQRATEITTEGNQVISGFDFSPKAQQEQQVRMEGDLAVLPKKAFADGSRVISAAAVKSANEMLTDAHRLNLPDLPQRKLNYAETLRRNGVAAQAIITGLDAAEGAGAVLKTVDLVNGVHAAIEAASKTGNFDIAIELAKNPAIPETKQTSLRTAIKTAESARETNVKNAETSAINTATSTAIRDYFKGEQTVANLNQKHEAGLIKDSEFKTMMKGLTETIPDNSNAFSAGKIRRAMSDFSAGDITRAEADKVISEQYEFLDGPDRSKVFADLEDVSTKIIATAKSNAYDEGKGLMSRRFVGIQSEEDLIDLFAGSGLSDEEKTRINRRFTAEINNRDLYERAVDDKFREMRRDKITDTSKFRAESLGILLTYQKRKTLSLEQFENVIAKEQQTIITPSVKPVAEMTKEEKRIELKKIQDLRRLAE